MTWALFAARVATVALGVLGMLGAMLAVTGIFGMASYTVSKRLRELGFAWRFRCAAEAGIGCGLWAERSWCWLWDQAGMALGVLAGKVLSYIVYQAAPKDPMVLAGVVLTMLVLGLVAAWIPAQKALGVNPVLLMREE